MCRRIIKFYKMKKISLLLLTALIAGFSFSQDVPFDKSLFKDQKDEFKEALKHYEEGSLKIDITSGKAPDFHGAIDEFLQAYKFNPKSADLNYKMGICYYNVDKYMMLPYFEAAYQLKPTVAQDVTYFIGLSYHLKGDWKKAMDYYDKAAQNGGTATINPHTYRLNLDESAFPTVTKLAFKRSQECKNGIELEGKKARVWIDNVGGEVNSKYPDYAPVISADEAIMVFTARRPDNESDLAPDGGGYFEDIYISTHENGAWTKSRNMGKP